MGSDLLEKEKQNMNIYYLSFLVGADQSGRFFLRIFLK